MSTNRTRLRATAATVAAGAITVAGFTLASSWAALAQAAPIKTATASATDMPGMAGQPAAGQAGYAFTTLDNNNDVTFNQLLGINNEGVIAGYFGSGAAGHPNKGYELLPPYGQGSYVNENFPHSAQTQVTGLNDRGVTVGFWSSMNNANLVDDNFGFYRLSNGKFRTVTFPTGDNANPPVNQLLGVNNHDVAVGFYVNGGGSNRGYTYNINTRKFSRVQVPGYPTGTAGPSLMAAGINNNGDIAGSYTDRTGATDAFLAVSHGRFRTLKFPGASATQAFGVNDHDEVVGAYTVGSGSTATMHGFTWMPGRGFATVDDPNGVGTTTVNGVNNAGDLVGFYVDSAGNTDGMLATPLRKTTVHLNLLSMPQGTVKITSGGGQHLVEISMFGLTPGSSHTVVLRNNPIGTLTADATGQAAGTFTVGGIRGGSRVEILNGTQTDRVSRELIAQTTPLSGNGSRKLTAVEVSASGRNYGTPQGQATLTYDPSAQTITVTLNASGVTPGAHAAHIHIGSCQSQGPVQYMLADFYANGNGRINHETRVVTGVTTPLPASGWYLNLHQGNMNTIVSNGQPTIAFRPLLCANIRS
jgi:Cu/Zn superoxide dismutase